MGLGIEAGVLAAYVAYFPSNEEILLDNLERLLHRLDHFSLDF